MNTTVQLKEGYTASMLSKDIFLTFLALVSILIFYLELSGELTSKQTEVIVYADAFIALIFLTDFCYSYWISPNKKAFVKERWWELPASIPLGIQYLQVFRSLQFIRIIRIFQFARVFRGASQFQRVLNNIQTFTEQVKLVYITNLLAIVIFSGALAFHYVEADVNPAVNTFLDSVWWSVSSVASLGAGDIYPTTDAGKVIGIVLVLVGVGVISAFTGLVASFIIRNDEE